MRLDNSRRKNVFPIQSNGKVPGGYMGKILRINLSEGKTTEEKLPEENVLRKYLGGQGLGQWILMHELPAGIDPHSPENILCIMTGPLTGTGKTPAGAAYTVTTFSNITGFGPLTSGTVVSSTSMGKWGPYLKFAGYDGLIIMGAAKTPTYLWIHDGKVEFKDASHLWGKDSHETENLIKEEIVKPDASVATIGPAGENLVRAAMILNDSNHSASHGGGAIMGSKKLKAIAVYGVGEVPVADPEALVNAGHRWRDKITPYKYPKAGTEGSFTYHQTRYGTGYGNLLGTLINKNWQSAVFPEANKDFNQQELTPRPCYKCSRACPYDAKITVGKHAGYIATLNAGSEHYEGGAFTFGIGGSDVRYLVDIMDRLGLEACNFGCAAGIAFEAYERGFITSKETDGLELKWGNAEVVERLMRKVATREGWLGNLLADGPRATAEGIGGEALKFAVFIKNGAPAMHDWRPHTGMMLGQIISSGGIKPQFASYEIPETGLQTGGPDLGFSNKTESQNPNGKARETFLSGVHRFFLGACGICWFGIPISAKGILYDVVDALKATTGWSNFNLEEALTVGERIWQMEHLFHIRYGWTPREDLESIGPRFLEPLPDGPFKGFSITKFLPDLVFDFYRECGWDKKTGKPKRSTIKKLGLEKFAK
jgi:aldehyde:ferredoxin oxidoreductase